jgi:hypothetical protein
MLNPIRALLLAGLVAAPAIGGAASQSARFVVRARVLDACTISAASVTDKPGQPLVASHCTPATPYRIDRDADRDAAEPRGADADRDEAAPVQTVTVTF